MPTYEYQCEKCNAVFEAMRSMEFSSAPAGCRCGGVAARIISVPQLIIRGADAESDTRKVLESQSALRSHLFGSDDGASAAQRLKAYGEHMQAAKAEAKEARRQAAATPGKRLFKKEVSIPLERFANDRRSVGHKEVTGTAGVEYWKQQGFGVE